MDSSGGWAAALCCLSAWDPRKGHSAIAGPRSSSPPPCSGPSPGLRRPAPPPDAAIGRDRAGGPATRCALQAALLLSGRDLAAPGYPAPLRRAVRPVGAAQAGAKPCRSFGAHSRARSPVAAPGAHSLSLSARGCGARWTWHCSTACWKPTAAWRWPKSCSGTAGRYPRTPRVGGGRADPAGAGSFPGTLGAPRAPRSERHVPCVPGNPSEPRSVFSRRQVPTPTATRPWTRSGRVGPGARPEP